MQEKRYFIGDGPGTGGDQGREPQFPTDLIQDVSSLGIGRSKHSSSSQVDALFSVNLSHLSGEKDEGNPSEEGSQNGPPRNTTNQSVPNNFSSFELPASELDSSDADESIEEVNEGVLHGLGKLTGQAVEVEQGSGHADGANGAPVDAAGPASL